MDIVYPRSQAHWESMFNRFSSSYFATVPGVYKSGGGGNYTGCAMNSSGCSGWRVSDGGRWFIRSSNFGEPNGDYDANCWLGITQAGYSTGNASNIGFNDGNCSYYTNTYICSTNDKP